MSLSFNSAFNLDYLRRRLRANLHNVGARDAHPDYQKKVDHTVDYVLSHYQAPGRHYHTLVHISDCMSVIDWITNRLPIRSDLPIADAILKGRDTHLQRELFTLELALWYHDVVYDPKLSNNEELSAAILRAHADDLSLDRTMVEVAGYGIMATMHKGRIDNPAYAMVVDIDLNILHAPEERFDLFERQARAEYAFVDDASWIIGRTKVLQGFLDRDWIYSTALFRRLFEGEARANLKRSITRLARGEIL